MPGDWTRLLDGENSNLLPNGSFEDYPDPDDVPTDWSKAQAGTEVTRTLDAWDGRYAVRVRAEGGHLSNEGIQQTVAGDDLTVGEENTVSVIAKTNGTGTPLLVVRNTTDAVTEASVTGTAGGTVAEELVATFTPATGKNYRIRLLWSGTSAPGDVITWDQGRIYASSKLLEEPDSGRVVDHLNRFTRQASTTDLDPGGVLEALFPKYRSVDFYVTDGANNAPRRRFAGVVIDPERHDSTLQVNFASNDYWLTADTVLATYTSPDTVSTVLEDLITSKTPITWDVDFVELPDDPVVERTWQGESLVDVIAELAGLAGAQEYGVTVDGRFFMRQRAQRRSPQDFVEGDHWDTDWEDNGAREVNRVTLHYGEGASTGIVVVNDVGNQVLMQERIGAASPVVVAHSVHYPEIDSEAAATAKASSILKEKTSLERGSFKAFGAYGARAGDVARVEDDEKAIDLDFTVASLAYNIEDAFVEVTLVRGDAGVIDEIVGLGGNVGRVDMRDADTAPVPVEIIEVPVAVDLEVHVQVLERSIPEAAWKWGEQARMFGDGGQELGDRRGAPTTLYDSENP